MHPVLILEIAAFCVFVAFTLFISRGWAERVLASLGRAVPAPLAAFALTLVLCAALSAVRPPAPSVHDELSYALAAETFASGRLTNPPHPFWTHFETFHVLQQPTYQSRYPPGQAMAMALGLALAGRSIVGVWLALAAAAAAACWALQFWVPRRWALFGALLPALRFGGLGMWDQDGYAYWSTSYWGGALAFLGGALLFGAAPRLLKAPRTRDGLLFGLGLAVLACTRPYEGLWAGALAGAVALWGVARARAWRRLAAPAGAVAAALGFLALYNASVTGSALRFPYAEYSRQYEVAPAFRFQPQRPSPAYRHEVIRRYNTGYRLRALEKQRASWGFDANDALLIQRFFLGPALAPVFLLGVFWRSRWRSFALLTLAAGAASHAAASTYLIRPHYFAPFVPALLLLTVQGLRLIKTLRLGRTGAAASQALLATVAATWLLGAGLRALAFEGAPNLDEKREAVRARLGPAAGGHLVLVRYAPAHNVHEEWVYNAADIDASAVVWAHFLSDAENRALIAYYSDRKIWLLEPDLDPPGLAPYPLVRATAP